MNRERNGKSRRDHGSYTSQNNTLSQPGMFCKSVSSHKGWLKTVYLISIRRKIATGSYFFFSGEKTVLFYSVLFIYLYAMFYFVLLFFKVTSV